MPTRQQTESVQDRSDIRFYSDGGASAFANLATDDGQYARNLSTGGTPDAVYLPAPATDFLLTTRTIALDITTSTTTACTLWINGTGSSIDRLRIASSQYEYMVNNATLVSLAVPAGAHQIVVVRTEPNPGAAFASEAYMTTIEVMDVTNNVLARAQHTHAARTFGANDFILLANTTAGASSLTDAGGVCDKIRVSSRAVPFTEIHQDWVSLPSAPTTVAKLQRQGLPFKQSMGIGAQGEMHGPAVQWAAAELEHVQWRTMGPLMNWRLPNVEDITKVSHTNTSHREKIRLAPGGDTGTGFRIRLGWFGCYPVHPFCNALWVEVHARCFNNTDADLRTFGFRLYSMNKRPVVGQGLAQPGDDGESLDFRYAEITFQSDEGEPGSWRLQTVMPVVVGASGISKGMTYLALAYAIDLFDEGTEAFRCQVKAINTVQLYNTTVGLPPGGGPAGESG